MDRLPGNFAGDWSNCFPSQLESEKKITCDGGGAAENAGGSQSHLSGLPNEKWQTKNPNLWPWQRPRKTLIQPPRHRHRKQQRPMNRLQKELLLLKLDFAKKSVVQLRRFGRPQDLKRGRGVPKNAGTVMVWGARNATGRASHLEKVTRRYRFRWRVSQKMREWKFRLLARTVPLLIRLALRCFGAVLRVRAARFLKS